VKIFTPAYTSHGKIAQARAYAAEVQLVEGLREELEAEAMPSTPAIIGKLSFWTEPRF